jgi:hypothetical protein
MFLKMQFGVMIKIEEHTRVRPMSAMAGLKNPVKTAAVEKETS